jgi:hypothetical protein
MFPYTSPAIAEGPASSTSSSAPTRASTNTRRLRAASWINRERGHGVSCCAPCFLAGGGAERGEQVGVDKVDLDLADAAVQVAHQAAPGAQLAHERDQLACGLKADEPQCRGGAVVGVLAEDETTPIRSARSPRSATRCVPSSSVALNARPSRTRRLMICRPCAEVQQEPDLVKADDLVPRTVPGDQPQRVRGDQSSASRPRRARCGCRCRGRRRVRAARGRACGSS